MKKIVVMIAVVAPMTLALGQQIDDATGLFEKLGDLLTLAVGFLFALAVLFFLYGLTKFIMKGGAEKQEGLNIMIWGVVALFVMTSVYGLVGLLSGTFNLDNNDKLDVPTLPTSSGSSFRN